VVANHQAIPMASAAEKGTRRRRVLRLQNNLLVLVVVVAVAVVLHTAAPVGSSYPPRFRRRAHQPGRNQGNPFVDPMPQPGGGEDPRDSPADECHGNNPANPTGYCGNIGPGGVFCGTLEVQGKWIGGDSACGAIASSYAGCCFERPRKFRPLTSMFPPCGIPFVNGICGEPRRDVCLGGGEWKEQESQVSTDVKLIPGGPCGYVSPTAVCCAGPNVGGEAPQLLPKPADINVS